jgi:hypothetical protein
MVDSKSEFFNNIVYLHSRMDKPLPRTATLSDAGLPPDTFLAHVRKNTPASIDFGFPSISGGNKRIALLVGFSLMMSTALMATAYVTVSLGLGVLSFFH